MVHLGAVLKVLQGMGQKKKLNYHRIVTEASTDPVNRLWSWDGPSELSTIEKRSWAFVPSCKPVTEHGLIQEEV